MTEEEKKYKEVIYSLKSLPKIKAKSDFEQKLYRKLRNAETEKGSSPAFRKLIKPKDSNWIFNIFRPAFIPAVGLTIALVAVIVIYISFIPKEEEITKTDKSPQYNEEMVIKEPGKEEDKNIYYNNEESGLITHDMSKSTMPDERSPLPLGPTSDVEESPAPTISQPEKLDKAPALEQTIERKEPDDKVMEKEGNIEKKVGDMKKGEKKESLKTDKSNEELNIKKNIDEEILQNESKPSMGKEKSRVKDSLKTDSIKSKKSDDKINENGQIEQKTETGKKAEPITPEP